ncbi:sensor histidine kinase [Nocardioides sp. MAH-18]|uniref:histidine kinase n=1 Tax=Nocardioides agri TaxID=2682843 RepID=A0A6L6XTR7_9ACTN|nr:MULTISPECIES: histidine kinase [unclassified Nocardioides]MBA2954183.1 sensor domain-containing protein [Nocardioides sp. CGMCC 1.13656]MVQ49045.1 sensor histidine kinase [Nocardioides sp. MAH-18]
MLLRPIRSTRPAPVDGAGLAERLRLTAVALGYAVAMAPALVLGIASLLCIPLSLVLVGLVLAFAVVPATAALTGVHRRVSGRLLGEEIPSGYADTAGTNLVTRPLRWVTDKARWRDVAFLWFSATGGFVLSLLPVALLTAPVTHLAGAVIDGGGWWWLLVALDGPLLVAWWCVTPALVRARAMAERGILGHTRVEQLSRRVSEVTASRAETLDHNAAEVRRIERDLHDGAQARIAAVGMNVGLAEKLIETDPAAAAELLREARETTVSALEDLRSVVRGIHPPALADRGLAGGIEALALPLPLPVTVAIDLPGGIPQPVESAAYFAVAECLTNTVKHAGASRAWVVGSYDDGVLHLEVGDDGDGGADETGGGLSGVRRRLEAFDGSLEVASPVGGPTIVTLEVPCGR